MPEVPNIEIGYQGWVYFNLAVIFMLVVDLGVFHRNPQKVSVRQALGWSAFWIALSLAFNGWVWHNFGEHKGLEFLTGYVLEKSLSVDNQALVSVNEAISAHPVEVIGKTLRAYMTDMKKII